MVGRNLMWLLMATTSTFAGVCGQCVYLVGVNANKCVFLAGFVSISGAGCVLVYPWQLRLHLAPVCQRLSRDEPPTRSVRDDGPRINPWSQSVVCWDACHSDTVPLPACASI